MSSPNPARTAVLPRSRRFEDVAQVVESLSLIPFRVVPQVFPGRPEPARVDWVEQSAAVAVRFEYHVDPDRRIVRGWGTAGAEALARVVAELGELTAAELVMTLRHGPPDDAHVAAFALADADVAEVRAVLARTLRERDDAFVQSACVRALERLGGTDAFETLTEVAYGEAAAAEVRAIARAVLSRLRSDAMH